MGVVKFLSDLGGRATQARPLRIEKSAFAQDNSDLSLFNFQNKKAKS